MSTDLYMLLVWGKWLMYAECTTFRCHVISSDEVSSTLMNEWTFIYIYKSSTQNPACSQCVDDILSTACIRTMQQARVHCGYWSRSVLLSLTNIHKRRALQAWYPSPHLINTQFIQPDKHQMQNWLHKETLPTVRMPMVNSHSVPSFRHSCPLFVINLEICLSKSVMLTNQRLESNWFHLVLHTLIPIGLFSLQQSSTVHPKA